MNVISFQSERIHYKNKNTFLSKFQKPYTLTWDLYLTETNECIGNVDIISQSKDYKLCEIGYVIGKPYQNKGYASECVDSIIQYMKENYNTSIIFAKFYNTNIASAKVLNKNKFEIVSRQNGYTEVQRRLL